ncbi:YkgJ family cysteine cluster protein [Halobaculum gomorrense]|uniref:Putative zinc-or iron-chelating domain-containing protein n=1 Tax=Halobaculum gomorrense TaxID=43928 RepID=A0A1M5T7K2_9EURY|nr:YkgJ family cysteine cluster protein [Halobaculum gomorrense]SHH46658.1 Putative zinc-or iron-chelating domain-containing protein [Halobaculum gomorrense]
MEVNCEGCAGCCLDWRPLGAPDDREREGRYRALDDAYNLVPLARDEIRGFVDGGLGDALVPRLFAADGDRTATVGGREVAGVDGRPAFLVGIRKLPKPVAPFDGERVWLDACAFLDPDTLKCRIHDTDRYPERCRTYPGHNLELDAETECERVERVHGETRERLVDDAVSADLPPPPLSRGALGSTVFLHHDPDALADSGALGRLVDGAATPADRAAFVAAAAASAPGTAAVNEGRYERARERVLAADSWVRAAAADWEAAAGARGDRVGGAPEADHVEVERGAPRTTEWGR